MTHNLMTSLVPPTPFQGRKSDRVHNPKGLITWTQMMCCTASIVHPIVVRDTNAPSVRGSVSSVCSYLNDILGGPLNRKDLELKE